MSAWESVSRELHPESRLEAGTRHLIPALLMRPSLLMHTHLQNSACPKTASKRDQRTRLGHVSHIDLLPEHAGIILPYVTEALTLKAKQGLLRG